MRLAIDGPVPGDVRALADAVADALAARAVPVARIRDQHWLRARSLRLEHGPDDPQAYLEGWFDVQALRREVLDPLGEPGDASYLPRLRDPVSDRSPRDGRVAAAPGLVAVLDVPFLARWETRDAVDVLVLLDVTPAGRARRVPADEAARVLPAWQEYLDLYGPGDVATAVVRYDRPTHPALLRAAAPPARGAAG